jgi:hypothetical protein
MLDFFGGKILPKLLTYGSSMFCQCMIYDIYYENHNFWMAIIAYLVFYIPEYWMIQGMFHTLLINGSTYATSLTIEY